VRPLLRWEYSAAQFGMDALPHGQARPVPYALRAGHPTANGPTPHWRTES